MEVIGIDYEINRVISADEFITLLHASTLGERRPVDDRECIQGMINNADLLVTAWDHQELVGVARSITDFHYACYLSDLAVHDNYQKCGIGRQLMALTREQLGSRCKLIAIAAPAADAYYEHVGFTNNRRCWVIEGHQQLKG